MEIEHQQDTLAAIKKTLLKSKSLENEQLLSILLDQYKTIFGSVSTTKGNTEYRTLACDTLSIWITRSLQFLGKNEDKLKCFTNFLSEQEADFIFHYVIDFWNDSGAALGNALKELFVKMISFLTVILTHDVRSELLEKWLITALALPYSMRALYFMVEHLHKHIDNKYFILEHKPTFVVDCLENISLRALGSIIGKSVFIVLKHVYVESEETQWMELWRNQVILCLKDETLRKGIESYLLPYLFQISKSATIDFLQEVIGLGDISILLSSLKVAQESGILIEPFMEIDSKTCKPLFDIKEINKLLHVSNPAYRIGAFQLLVSSPKLSKAIPSCVYDNIIESLDVIFTDTDLESRSDIYAYFKRFVYRVKDSTYALKRDADSLTKKNFLKFEEEIKAKLLDVEKSRQFFTSLLTYIQSCLTPSSSYLKKEMAFKLLIVLVKSGLDANIDVKFIEKTKSVNFAYSISIYDGNVTRLAIDNITDNFEDIRSYSTEIITMSPFKLEDSIDMDLLETRALEMLCDIKGKDVDSGARFLKFFFNYYQYQNNIKRCEEIMALLLNKIDISLNKANENIAIACVSYSIQGYFAALKFIFEIIDFKKCNSFLVELNAIDRLISASAKIWEVVKVILKHDSPEGIFLEEFQSKYTPEMEAKYGKGSQVILSYAWRSIKESSNMIDVLLKLKNSPFSNEQILQVGPLLLEQLATIRHRGAFSSVYPTFISCCRICTTRDSLSKTPELWLNENLNLIQARSKYITRRSAGIPFLITAVLSSNKKLVKSTFYKLLEVAKMPVEEENAVLENVNLPQVNAFNCIKTIFIDASLSEESISYVDEAFALTLSSFASPFWAIRNCAVMLFTALQNRLFSSKKVRANYMTSYPARLFFEKFDSIHSLFLNTLKESVDNGLSNQSEIEKVFPILTIMGRLEPTPGYNGLADFIPVIIAILENKIWKLREMAARSLPSLVSSSATFKIILSQLINNIQTDSTNFNKMHGSLLAIREMITKFQALSSNETTNDIDSLLKEDGDCRQQILSKLSSVTNEINSYPIKMTYFQILKLVDFNSATPGVQTLFSWFYQNNKIDDRLDGGKQLALKELSEILYNFENSNRTSLIESSLSSTLYEVQLSCIDHFLGNIDNLTQEEQYLMIDKIWSIIENQNVWKYVKSQGLKLLKELLVVIEGSEIITDIEQRTNRLIDLHDAEFNEDIKLSVVETLGSYIARLMTVDEMKYVKLYNIWQGYIKSMISDDLEFIIRDSALKSLLAFDKVYRVNGKNKEIQVNVEGYLFQFLTDDDENIQKTVSEHISKYILKLSGMEVVPIVVQKLMVEYFATFKEITLLEQLINHEGIRFYDLKSCIGEILEVDSLLFGSEKDNIERNPITKVNELVFLINNTEMKTHKQLFSKIGAKIQQNIEDLVAFIKTSDVVDGCFGIFSNEALFDFISCQIILYNCLKINDLVDYDIVNFKELLQRPTMYTHPVVITSLEN